MSQDILGEQLAYYRARAQEYDESIQEVGRFATPEPVRPNTDREWASIVAAIHALAPVGDVLELACGTGMWTQELVKIAASVTALDGAPEMVEANRAKLNDPRVNYQVVDLFQWHPEEQYDLVFFGFWLSHVPPDRLPIFLDKVSRSVRPGGRLFIVDEPNSNSPLSGENEGGQFQNRTLHDGREFRIVKVYYDPTEIQSALAERGFRDFTSARGQYFFHLSGQKAE
jgi:ubiquinone/menaquinone biosynthesis C-methylase UbiE